MIEVKDVCKSFGKDMKVKHVTVTFDEGSSMELSEGMVLGKLCCLR